jgi:hypothetical protein
MRYDEPRLMWTKLTTTQIVCVYYYSTYYKAVRVGGGGTMEDMCYEGLRAEACVD